MNADDQISLAVLGQPGRQAGRLISIRGLAAELRMDGGVSPAPGTLVEFETGHTLYLGEVEPALDGQGNGVVVRLAHVLDLEKIASIRRTWNAERAE